MINSLKYTALSTPGRQLLNSLTRNDHRLYTVIVERCVPAQMVKKDRDVRSAALRPKDYQYKFVDCQHVKKWGETQVILTDYVEGERILFRFTISAHFSYFLLIIIKVLVIKVNLLH
jgi:hypothetical protein